MNRAARDSTCTYTCNETGQPIVLFCASHVNIYISRPKLAHGAVCICVCDREPAGASDRRTHSTRALAGRVPFLDSPLGRQGPGRGQSEHAVACRGRPFPACGLKLVGWHEATYQTSDNWNRSTCGCICDETRPRTRIPCVERKKSATIITSSRGHLLQIYGICLCMYKLTHFMYIRRLKLTLILYYTRIVLRCNSDKN